MDRIARTLLLIALCLGPAYVRADALEDFERGEAAYREQRYGTAVAILEQVLAAMASESVDTAIVLETRKYLAACYLFLERPDDAERQFELLLELDPTYRLDPVVFPRAVLDRFDAVRARIEDAREAERESARQDAERRLAEALAARERDLARYAELHDLAASAPVFRENSRLLALLPFGAGQYQNRRRGLGRFFAIAESLTLAVGASGMFWYRAIEDVEIRGSDDELRWSRAVDASRAFNWVGMGSFLTLVLAGAVEAEVNFVPVRVTSQRRTLPEELAPTRPVPVVSVLPNGITLHLRF